MGKLAEELSNALIKFNNSNEITGAIKKKEEGLYSVTTEAVPMHSFLLEDPTTILKLLNGDKEIIKHYCKGLKPRKGHKFIIKFGERLASIDYKNRTYIFHIYEIDVSLKNELPYGTFLLVEDDYGGLHFKDMVMPELDQNLIASQYDLNAIVDDIFNRETKRKNKAGVLSYGPPGNGKTTDIVKLSQSELSKSKRRVIFLSESVSIGSLSDLRKYFNKEDQTVFVFEELTQRLNHNNLEQILSFLDGETSWENSVTIATTNYPSELPINLIDRPGRFEILLEYKHPTKEQIDSIGKLFEFTPEQVITLHNKNLSFDYVSFILDKAKRDKQEVSLVFSNEQTKRKKLSETFMVPDKMGI